MTKEEKEKLSSELRQAFDNHNEWYDPEKRLEEFDREAQTFLAAEGLPIDFKAAAQAKNKTAITEAALDIMRQTNSVRRALKQGKQKDIAMESIRLSYSTLTLAQAIAERNKKLEKTNATDNRYGVKRGRFTSAEEFVEACLEKLKERVESGEYSSWNHLEFLEDVKSIHPYGEVKVKTWWADLRKTFLKFLREEHPHIVKEH